MYALGFRCSKRDARNVFDFFDKDGGGEIEYKELNRGLRDGVVARNVKGPAPPTTPKGKGGKGPAPRKTRKRESEREDAREHDNRKFNG